jgi:hypothetical protein
VTFSVFSSVLVSISNGIWTFENHDSHAVLFPVCVQDTSQQIPRREELQKQKQKQLVKQRTKTQGTRKLQSEIKYECTSKSDG